MPLTKTSSFLLDTHVWFRSQANPGLIRITTRNALAEAAERNAIYASVVSVWELAHHERAGKLNFIDGVAAWVQSALSQPGITLLPYTPEIAIDSVFLPAPMHKDPTDRILIASARIEKLTIVTADKAMLAFARSSGLPFLKA